MLTLEEALAAVTSGIRPATGATEVSLAQSRGRYLAAPLVSRCANPPFTNSSMDGYALASKHGQAGRTLPVAGESRCGAVPSPLVSGTAMRIFTGAPMPAGADAVIMQEEVALDGDSIRLEASVARGRNVRVAGEDFGTAAPLYSTGHRLRPMDLALLAIAGIDRVSVRPPPRALVFATGDELIPPGSPLAPGQVYESNRLATIAMLEERGAEVVDGGIVRDDLEALRQVVAHATDYDFIITSGGVSVGNYDFVKRAFAEVGEVHFWRARIKPGKPLAFGHLRGRAHFFALPGNPVSSLVTFKLFVESALATWYGAPPERPELTAVAAHTYTRAPGRTEFLRARLRHMHGQLLAWVFPGQGSHMVGPLAKTNGLVRLSDTMAGFTAGDPLSVVPLDLDFS
ncbi:MAG: molybdopterin molybdotransferase MoeA [Acidiferrobacteraceae bacterium]